MSYCRWSDMGFQCDAYVYESQHGFEIHLAVKRRPPGCPEWDTTTPEAFTESNLARQAWLDDPANESAPIGLPCDGEDYTLPTAAECAEKLRELRGMGYVIPDYAIEELEAEAVEAE